MNTDMKLQKVPVEKLKPAKYNPRKDLKPGDPAYEKIKRSMTTPITIPLILPMPPTKDTPPMTQAAMASSS